MQTFQLTGSAVTGIESKSPKVKKLVEQLPTEVKLGCILSRARYNFLRLENYFDPNQLKMTVPTSINRRDAAAASIAHMYLNDRYGNCVIASKAHAMGVWSANDSDSGGVVLATDAEIYSQYQSWCGPGDNGCIITNVLSHMASEGFVASGKTYKIDDAISASNTDKLLVQVAQYIFGATCIGFEIPQAWMSSNVWDVTNSPIVGGHDVAPIDYDEQGVYVASWGRIYLMTWAAFLSNRWIFQYFIMLSPLWYGADKVNSATGIDITHLKADLDDIRNGITPNIGPPTQVLDGPIGIPNNVGVDNFDITLVSVPVTKTFTVLNNGTNNLVLGALTIPNGFTLVNDFGSMTILPGAFTNFSVKLNALALGDYTGHISFTTNDPDANPFTFTVTGSVVSNLFSDDFSDSVISTVWSLVGGSWSQTSGVLSQTSTSNSYPRMAIINNQTFPSDLQIVARVRVDNWTDGDYARAGVALYTNTNGMGYGLVFHNNHNTVQFLNDSVVWGKSANFAWQTGIWYWFKLERLGNTLYGKVWASSDPEPSAWMLQQSGWTDRTGGFPALNGGAANAGHGSSSASFDDVMVIGKGSDVITQVADDEDANLTGTWNKSNSIKGYNGVGYRTSVAGDGSNVATWTFNVTPGTYKVAATWTAASNRASNAPYTVLDNTTVLSNFVSANQKLVPNDFTYNSLNWETIGIYKITSSTLTVRLTNKADGYVIADAIYITPVTTPVVQIVDDADTNFSTVGTWAVSSSVKGYKGIGYHSSPKGTGSNVATWSFTVTPGSYKVAATWTAASNRASNAPYTVADNTPVIINQQLVPNDFIDLGTYTVTGTVLVVKLSDKANGYVIADAIRVESV